MRRYRAFVLALALALVPSSLSAQTQFAISGFGGVFLPASDLAGGTYRFQPGEIPGFDGGDVAATFTQKTAFNFGGRLTVWPSQRIGFEAEAAFVLADMNLDLLIPIIDPGPPQVVNLVSPDEPFKIESNLFMGSVNLVYGLIRPPLEPLVVFVSVGVGFVSRGGDSGDYLETTSNVAGTWGFGLKYGVARGVWLRGDVRDYVYKFEEGDWEAKWQNDLLVNAGLEFSFGG